MRVYVAGPYSGHTLNYLDNIRKGQRLCTELLLKGYDPFCPWFDFHFQLNLREGETLTVADYHRCSIAWMRVAEAVLVRELRPSSKGTKAEIKEAERLGIPVFFSVEDLDLYRKAGRFLIQ